METVSATDHGQLQRARNSDQTPTFPTAYWPISPELVPHCPAKALGFLSVLADVVGNETDHATGSTTFTVNYRNRDVSKHLADKTGIADRCVDDRLADLRKLPGVSLDYAETGDVLTIKLPAIEGTRRPQVPKGTGLSGRALKVWLALQLSPRSVSVSKLAEVLDCSADTVRRAETELVKAGLVARVSAPGKAHIRVLAGLVRSNPQREMTPRKSGAGPLAKVALFPLPKQRSYKGQGASGAQWSVHERIPGHTRESSTFNRWEDLDESELAKINGPIPGPSTMTAKARLASMRESLRNCR